MGRQYGLVHLSGQFGDIQMSVDGEKGYARQVTPTSKKRIQHDRNFGLTRLNNAEFGGAGKVVDAILRCIGGGWSYYAERYFRPRLHGKVRKLMLLGPGYLGQRSFIAAQHLSSLQGIELDSKDPVGRRFRGQHSYSVNVDRHTATLTVEPFHTVDHLDVPRGATHFRLFLLVGALCDFIYSSGSEAYVPAEPLLDGLHAQAMTGLIACDGRMNSGFQLSAELPGLPVLGTNACLLVSLGIEFVREVNGVVDIMAAGGGIRVVGCW